MEHHNDYRILRKPTDFMGRKPARTVQVPRENRRSTLLREREILTQTIKEKTRCDILLHSEGTGLVTRIDVYGGGAGSTALDKAVQELNDWVRKAPTKSREASSWPKQKAHDANKWYYDEVKIRDQIDREKFKGKVPENEELPCKMLLSWPDDFRNRHPPIGPRDVFGPKLEALDPIRVEMGVYITLKALYEVEVQGSDIDRVNAAEQGFQTMIHKARVNMLGGSDAKALLLDESEGIELKLVEADEWWPDRTLRIVPRLIWSPMMNEMGSFRHEAMHPTQLRTIKNSISLALEKARYEKGAYDFHIRLGCLVMGAKNMAPSEIGKKYSKSAMMGSLDNGTVETQVKKWLLNDADGKIMLSRLMGSEGILEPVDPTNSAIALREAKPAFRATFIFRDPNASVPTTRRPENQRFRPSASAQPVQESNSPVGLVIMQIDWAEDEHGQYEKLAPKYFTLKPGQAEPKEFMDINLFELVASRAWHFSLESMTPLVKRAVPAGLINFADKVKMKPNYDLFSSQSFVTFDQRSSMVKNLTFCYLDKIYRFRILKTCYTIDARARWYRGQIAPVWGIDVRHSEWATHLAELEWLRPGKTASWNDAVHLFLPDDGQTSFVQQSSSVNDDPENPRLEGIGLLMNRLMQISDTIHDLGSGASPLTM